MKKVFNLFLKKEDALYEEIKEIIFNEIDPIQFCMNVHTGELEIQTEGYFCEGKAGEVSGDALILGEWDNLLWGYGGINEIGASWEAEKRLEKVRKILERKTFCVPECPLLF